MTRIGITLDAASINEASVATFARAGANFVRFIAKGMTPRIYLTLAKAFIECGRAVQADFDLVFDLPGRRPRLGSTFEEQTVYRGMTVLLVDEETRDTAIKSKLVIPTVNLNIYRDVIKVGDRMLISDGATELKVLELLPAGVLAEATRPKTRLTPNRSILMPDTDIHYQSLSDMDVAFAEAIANSNSFPAPSLAVSMVETPAPIERLRQIVPQARVIAKVETRNGLVNRDAIANAADVVMIARGDLSLSLGVGMLPAAANLILQSAVQAETEAMLATGIFDGVGWQDRPSISDLTDLWHYWELGVRNFLLSGGDAGRYGRRALEFVNSSLSDFRFASEDLGSAPRER
jgi:pyruvate kinase